MIGKRLSHYEITAKLGAGGMGEVYAADDTRLGRRVAIKVLPEEVANDPDRLERFEREARAVAALNHPCIVTIHSVEEADGIRFITMELVDGRTLGEATPPDGFRLEEFFKIAIATGDALAAAHEQGIVHRDLKPANVMVTPRGGVKILDFGLAKLHSKLDEKSSVDAPTEALTGDGRVIGTVPFMAPEQLQGKETDHRADIFSFGVLLYEMATGRHPFQGESGVDVISAIMRDRPPTVDRINDGLPSQLGRVIDHCLEKDPARRWQSVQDLRNALEDMRRSVESGELLTRSSASRPAEAVAVPVASEAKSERKRWGVIAGAIAVVALAAGFYLTRDEARPVGGAAPERADATAVTTIDSVAVLPFEDFSEGGTQGHLARGVADTVLNLLAKVPDLRVAARTSSFSYRESGKDLPTIADELGVGAVLEGSVQRSGDRLRIVAQLVAASGESQLWSETFDRPAEDVFAIQDEIAASVLGALRPEDGTVVGTGGPASERTDVEAYERFLRARDAYFKNTTESVEQALEDVRIALTLDPDFVPALVLQSRIYVQLNNLTPRTFAEIEPLAQASLDRALALAPDDPGVLSAFGEFTMNAGYDLDSAASYLERALALNPNDVRAHSALVATTLAAGRFNEALAHSERSYLIDPNNPLVAAGHGAMLIQHRRYDEARAIAERLIATRPNETWGPQLLGYLEATRGRWDLALPHRLRSVELNPDAYDSYHTVSSVFARLDAQEQALAWYEGTPPELQTRDYLPAHTFLTADDVDRYVTLGERNIEVYPGWDSGERTYVAYLAVSGRVEDAVAAAERFESALYSQAPGEAAAYLGVHARRVGNDELAGRLLSFAAVRNEAQFQSGWAEWDALSVRAALALAEENFEGAVAALREAFDGGNQWIRWYRLDPAFDPLRERPDFKALMADIEAELATQRERLREQGLMDARP